MLPLPQFFQFNVVFLQVPTIYSTRDKTRFNTNQNMKTM